MSSTTGSSRTRLFIFGLLGVLVLLAGCGQLLPAPPSSDIDLNEHLGTENNSSVETTAELNGSVETPSPDEIEIHHIDVGDGESTLVVTPRNDTILIDTGPAEQDGERVIEYLESQNVTEIDQLVATHSDPAHIGGHAAVIRHYETELNGVGKLYQSRTMRESDAYAELQQAIDQFNISTSDAYSGTVFYSQGLFSVRAVSPPPFRFNGSNGDHSLSLLVEYDGFSELLSAGAEQTAKKYMLQNWGSELESEVYHVGSGNISSSASTNEFIPTVRPYTAIVTRMQSTFSHPDQLKEIGVDQYWTAHQGTIVITSNGTSYQVQTET
ncbi:Competence-like protein [Halorhabdus tiamatea SARL4B]|uniref:Competence-like protein n=1 Tax=Halorhabdus tiamatea SARL4B TaxID=1033806 RepID=U2DP41_9EURY|nr:MBL fold metallo-hydrolase [Halorhabdus tiamatea]ERJ07412.1 Competence-like protein [Halorhabdus tiamatea SARL4B]